MWNCLLLIFVFPAIHACCTPLQWEMQGGFLQGNRTSDLLFLQEVNFDVHYDAKNLRVAFTTYNIKNPDMKTRIILEYEQQRMYKIDLLRNMCTVELLDSEFEAACTPEGSTITKHFYYGGGDQEELQAAIFSFDRPAYSGYVHVTEGTQPDGTCVPIISYTFNLSFMNFMSFMNITDGISDPGIFVPPSSCQFQMRSRHQPPSKLPRHPFLRTPMTF